MAVERQKPILNQIAEHYGINVKTVTRRIKEHPELGIEIKKAQAPVLDEKQIQALCAILDERYNSKPKENETLQRIKAAERQRMDSSSVDEGVSKPSPAQTKTNDNFDLDLFERAIRAEERASAMEKEIARLEALLNDAVSERKEIQAKADEEREKHRAEMSAQAKLLETAEANEARAKAEASSYVRTWYGRYKKVPHQLPE